MPFELHLKNLNTSGKLISILILFHCLTFFVLFFWSSNRLVFYKFFLTTLSNRNTEALRLLCSCHLPSVVRIYFILGCLFWALRIMFRLNLVTVAPFAFEQKQKIFLCHINVKISLHYSQTFSLSRKMSPARLPSDQAAGQAASEGELWARQSLMKVRTGTTDPRAQVPPAKTARRLSKPERIL